MTTPTWHERYTISIIQQLVGEVTNIAKYDPEISSTTDKPEKRSPNND